MLGVINTLFVLVVLFGGTLCFIQETDTLVLKPIYNMINNIKLISKNPIEALQKDDELEEEKSQEEEKYRMVSCLCRKYKEAPLETKILEKTITKIGALLALGFGEAGSEIISKNMQNNNDGEVNPMIPGKKVMAIYGFCDIRNFTDTTEVLEEEVMIFVNEIAEIVHGITSEHWGSANKNIGDAFLLVWKFDDKFVELDSNGDLRLKKCREVEQIVDYAMISFLKIIYTIYKSYKLDKVFNLLSTGKRKSLRQ